MEKIEKVALGPMSESQYLKPLRMKFTQNGRQKFWDFCQAHESVACILFDAERKVLIFVKQFRPVAFWLAGQKTTGSNKVQETDWSLVPPSRGITLELCAGLVDQPGLTLQEIVKKEVLEECGYEVPLDSFQKVMSFPSSIAQSASRGTVFYAEVKADMKVSEGGGLVEEGELIEVVEMTLEEVRKYISQEEVNSPPGFLFAVWWFLANKAPKDS